MSIFEGSVVLPVSPDRAFRIVGDPKNGPIIDLMIQRYEPEGGEMHEGGRNHIRMRAFGVHDAGCMCHPRVAATSQDGS